MGGDKLFLALEREKRLVGYLSSRDMCTDPFSVVYIQAIVTLRNVQGTGIGSFLVRELIKAGNYSHLAAQTQNPVVYVLLAKVSGEIYPQPDVILPTDISMVGRILSRERKISINETTLIVRNAYGDSNRSTKTHTRLVNFLPSYQSIQHAAMQFL